MQSQRYQTVVDWERIKEAHSDRVERAAKQRDKAEHDRRALQAALVGDAEARLVSELTRRLEAMAPKADDREIVIFRKTWSWRPCVSRLRYGTLLYRQRVAETGRRTTAIWAAIREAFARRGAPSYENVIESQRFAEALKEAISPYRVRVHRQWSNGNCGELCVAVL
jgi:hypothetical protein